MRRVYSYLGFEVEVELVSGRAKRVRILGRCTRPLRELPPLEPVLEGLTPFQRAVVEAVRRIPPGRVATYSVVASAAGFPGAARGVGRVMAANRTPILVPCHRVVRSDLTLGGFSGGVELKRELLRAEGVRFVGERVHGECLLLTPALRSPP